MEYRVTRANFVFEADALRDLSGAGQEQNPKAAVVSILKTETDTKQNIFRFMISASFSAKNLAFSGQRSPSI
jgi:hypothetical protein